MYWKQESFNHLKKIVFDALKENSSFHDHSIMGLPATYLDPEIFPADAPFLYDSPYIKCFIENPNHIGLHTYNTSLPTFKGTQSIELDLLRICAEEIYKADSGEYDGYVAPGGTECNIQAIWIYREYFKNIFAAGTNEIIVLFSEDTHYSLYKACNLLGLKFHVLPVDNRNRCIDYIATEKILDRLINRGVKHIISIANMGTTMFGSIDDVDSLSALYLRKKINFKIHIDAAFGGFIYPFSNPKSTLNFKNANIQSISVDGHKMLQAPYGTGIFIIRKDYIDNVITEEASYVEGHDHTLCGSRSGANSIATWMILNVHGSEGMKAHMATFIEKTDYICNALNKLNVRFFRNDNMNIITIRSEDISEGICKKYTLVPNSHTESPEWWKIVVMDHVNWDLIDKFIFDLGEYRKI